MSFKMTLVSVNKNRIFWSTCAVVQYVLYKTRHFFTFCSFICSASLPPTHTGICSHLTVVLCECSVCAYVLSVVQAAIYLFFFFTYVLYMNPKSYFCNIRTGDSTLIAKGERDVSCKVVYHNACARSAVNHGPNTIISKENCVASRVQHNLKTFTDMASKVTRLAWDGFY